jgi:predicted Zn-dependent peptidase
MVRRARFDAEHLEPVRDLSLQALAGLADDPQARAGVLLNARHAPPPLDRSRLGTQGGLSAASREDCAAAWERAARPGGSILAVAGAVDAAAVASRLDELLRGWTGNGPELMWGSSATAGTPFHEPDDTNQVQIYVCHDAPNEGHPDSTLERLLMAVLSGGSSSRLFTQVRERRGLCYSVHADYSAEKHFGRVTGYVGTTPEKAQQSLDVMLAELARVATPEGTVTPEELSRAVVGYKSRLVFSGESTAARAAALAGDFYRLGRARTLAEVAAKVDPVTLDELNAYARRRAAGPYTIVTLGPKALVPPSGVCRA